MTGVRIKELESEFMIDGRMDRFDGERERVIKLEKWLEDVKKFKGGRFEIQFERGLIFEGLNMKFGNIRFSNGKVPVIPFRVICGYRGVCVDYLADWFQDNALQFALLNYIKRLEGKKVLVFVPTKALGLALCEFFAEKMIASEVIGFEGDYAKEVSMDFESGFTKLIFVVGESFDGDFSDVDVVLNLLPVWDEYRWSCRLKKLKFGERKRFEVEDLLFGNLRPELQSLYNELFLKKQSVEEIFMENSETDDYCENFDEKLLMTSDKNVVNIEETVMKIKVEILVSLFLDGMIKIISGEDLVLRFIENRNFEEFLKSLSEGAVRFVLNKV